jgi:hypothetical protein
LLVAIDRLIFSRPHDPKPTFCSAIMNGAEQDNFPGYIARPTRLTPFGHALLQIAAAQNHD